MGIRNGKISRRRIILILALVVALVGAMTVFSHATEIDSCSKYDASLDTYELPGDTDFVVIKQASGNLLVWTKSTVNDTEKSQIIDAARRVAKDGAIKGNENIYWITGYQIFKAASAGISDNQWGAYGFSISSAGKLIVNVYDANGTTLNHGRISHLDYGKFKVVTGTISLKKSVVNGSGVTGTFYFKLTDSSGAQFGDLKSIVINNGSMAKNTAQWTNVPLGAYTITETDSQGTALKDGNTTFGKELVDISNGNAVNVTLDSTAEITNTFKDIPASVQFGATKEMSGREFKAGETYEFDLYKGTDTSAAPIDTVSTTADSGHSQTLQFGKLTYDAAGTYVYTVKEKNGGQTIDGVKYSDRTYKVTVTVAKNDSGRLQADYVITDDGDAVNSAVFTNTYSASGDVQLEAQKTLQHKTLRAGDFSFTATEVKDAAGTAMTGSDVWTGTASNDAAGKVLFDKITYDSEGTHYYKITENLPKDAVSGISGGVKYDQSAVIIEVKAADEDHNGELTVTKKVVGGSGSVAQFTNTRLGKITLTKKIENGSGLNGLFYFKLLDSTGKQIGDLKTVIVQDGVAVNTVVWEDLDYGEYTVIETDKDGKALAAGDTVLGRELVSISSSNNTKVTLETTENAHVDVTPDNISWNDGSGSNLFGSASNINLLAFGNVENIIDVEGSTAVKGNFTSSRGFSTGMKNKQYSADVGLMVGGNTSFGGYATVAGHGVTGNGTFSAGGAEYRVAKDGYTAAALQALYGAGYVNDNGSYYMLGKSSPSDMRIKDADEVTSFFSNAKTYMEDLQDQLASLTATGKTLYNESTVVLSGSDADLNVFDLDASKAADKKVEVDCPSTSTVIVNVKAGSSDGAITTYNPAWGTQSLATKTIFNFTDCSKLTMTGGTAFYGSVLAPEMDLDVNGNGGNINGNAVVNDLLNSTGGFECHEYYFNGTLPGDGSVSITNTFGAGGYVDLTATKVLENKEFKAGDFTFEAIEVKDAQGTALTGNSVWKDTAQNDKSGNVSFKRIDYKTADVGDHFYKITEVVPDGAVNNVKDGITYTTKEVIVKVTVADDKHDGSLTVTRSIVKGDNTVFTNKYSAGGNVQLQATKVLTGKTLTAGAFSFTATEVKDKFGNALVPAAGETVWSDTKTNAASGDVSFDTIHYTLADVGTHYYKITETKGTAGGITYDAKTVIVAVNVTDNGKGILTADKSVVSGTDTTFTNKYDAGGHVVLTAHKTLTGRTMKAGEFSFTAAAVDEDGNVLTGDKAWSSTKKNDGNGDVSFDTIHYTLADVGTHYYRITEAKGPAGGVTYDEKAVTVTVAVTDNGDGTLKAEKSVTGDTADATFANTYSARGEVQLQAYKVLQNKELTAGAFSFTATEVKDAAGTALEPKTGESVWSNTKSNDGNGNVTFDTIHYTVADLGTHYYKITEASGGTAGVTYDAKIVIVAVNVTDNGDGTLTADKSVISGTDTTFTNIYNAVGHKDLTAHKTLKGRTMAAGEFSFTAAAVDENSTVLTGNKAWSDTKENDASGNVSFKRIEYTTADIGVHYYKVTELIPKDAVDGSRYGVKYTTATVTYKVTVKDDVKDGNLEITREVVGDSTANTAEFTNEYSARGEAQIKVNKELTGKDLSAGEFSFKAEAVDADGNALTGDNAWSDIRTNDSDGNVTFTPVNYTLADAGHTYKYKITEVIPAQRDSKITYAEEPVYATVTVGEDNGDGTLKTSTVTYNPNDTFTNVYDAEGSAVLHADKVLDGRTMAAGEFSFAVYPEGEDTSVAEGTNEANGTVAFSPITYKYADLGGAASKVFTYDIKESSAQTGTGITYDNTVYKAKVTVSNDGSGELKTAVKYYEPDGTTELTGTEVPTFENKYDANGSVSFTAQKTLNGRDLADNEFEFGLYNEDGTKLIESAKCSANGAVKFDAVNYGLSDAGKTFTYKIKEIAGSDTTVVYDTTEYTAEVKVTDNGRGTLETAVAYTDAAGQAVDEPAFTNNAKIGSIKVTKNTFNADETARAVQDTFYVALFDSTDTATAKRISDVRAINMDGASSQTVTFEGLELGTYYVVFETDADGNIITDPASQGGIENWVGNGYENNEVTPTLDFPDGETVVNNYYDNTEYQYGSIKVSKTVKVNGKGKASNMTFYTALFSDISCTDRVTDVKALKMNGNKSTTVEFATDRNNKQLDSKAKYYVAETTKDGTAITNGKRQLGCTIGISAKTVGIDVAGIPAKSTITNSYTDEEEYYYESTKSTKTGDDSNMGIWAALAAAAAALGSAAALFRRKNRDESSNS